MGMGTGMGMGMEMEMEMEMEEIGREEIKAGLARRGTSGQGR